MASNTDNAITTGFEEVKEVYKKSWTIKKFDLIGKHDELINSQSFELHTSQIPNTRCTWLIGLRAGMDGRYPSMFLYCQLVAIKGRIGPKITASLEIDVLLPHGTNKSNTREIKTFETGDQVVSCILAKQYFSTYTFPDGSLKLELELTIFRHVCTQEPVRTVEDNIKALRSRSLEMVHDNLLALLSDEESCDPKIITSDKVELSGHKLILKMQNPVFASMLLSDFSESKTGIVRVDDASAKTMRIILRYLYTGDLLSSWSDADVIAEFTYAAGKYQLTEVLKMLDDTLGIGITDEHGSCIMPLLSLTNRLSLKKAENRLLERLRQQAAKAGSADELFAVVAGQGNLSDPGLKSKAYRRTLDCEQ